MLAPALFCVALGVIPGLLWRWRGGWRAAAGEPAPSGIAVAGNVVLLGALHDLILGALLDVTGSSLRRCALVWLASLAVPLLWRGRRRAPESGRRIADPAATLAAAVVGALLAVWVAVTPAPLDLGSDAPAHLGAIRDALQTDRLRPPDLSVAPLLAGATERASDPRFGLAHGVYALVAQLSHCDPARVWSAAPIAVAPLYLLAHTWLFTVLGLAAPWALLAALLWSVGGAGGRAFGVWFAGYPAQLAVALATLGMAAWIDASLASARSWTQRWRGPALVASTTLIHPLGWLLACAVMLQAALLCALRRALRPQAWRWLLTGLATVLLGALLMAPRLAERKLTASGLHDVITDALFLGGGLFVVDPLGLAFWSGWASLLALPLVLLQAPSFMAQPRRVVALAGAAVVWTVALNPLVQPLAWKLASYLSVRMGRMAWTPLLWMLLLGFAVSTLRRSRRALARACAVIAIALGGLQALGLLRTTWHTARAGPPAQDAASWQQLSALASALDGLPAGMVAADPRSSYGLRALRGGPVPIYPVAHSSPADTGIARRLASYRSLFAPDGTLGEVVATLDSLAARYLLVNERVERMGSGDFGYVPNDSAQHALGAWLQATGVAPLRAGPAWSLYDRAALRTRLAIADSARSLQVAALAANGSLAQPVEGSRIAVVGIHPLRERVAAGGSLPIEVCYAPSGGPPRTVHPGWERFYLRLEGPQAVVPRLFTPVSKLYRKFVLEDSGRSLARFGDGWVPFNGTWEPSRWPAPTACERRSLNVPRHVRPGRYTLQLTVQEAVWRPRRDLRDYLSDVDRWSGPPVGTIQIDAPVDSAPAPPSGGPS